MVARQSLTLFVKVRVLVPQPKLLRTFESQEFSFCLLSEKTAGYTEA